MTIGLSYTEEHELLRAEARRFLSDHCPIARVREIARGGRPPDLSRPLAELGWLGLVLPEDCGGAGLGFTHLAVLLEETGRALLPAPLLSATLAGLAILYGGAKAQRAELLPDLAAGARRATLAYVEPDGAWDFRATRCVRTDGRLRGVKCHVWDAHGADLLIVPFRERGSLRVAVVDGRATGVALASEVGLDPTRPSARVTFREVELPEERILAASGEALQDSLTILACAALAAEQIGGADALLAMTAAYAATRNQFGKPIGAFQAVKHPLVDVLIGVEQGRSLVYAAASALDAAPRSPAPSSSASSSTTPLGAAAELRGEGAALARMAKAHASDTYVFAASRAIQLHGGFGFTLDCDAHLYFKRAQASRAAWGDAAHHRRHLGDRLIAASSASSHG